MFYLYDPSVQCNVIFYTREQLVLHCNKITQWFLNIYLNYSVTVLVINYKICEDYTAVLMEDH